MDRIAQVEEEVAGWTTEMGTPAAPADQTAETPSLIEELWAVL